MSKIAVHHFRVLVVVGILFWGGLNFGANAAPRFGPKGAPSPVPGEILVRFKHASDLGLGSTVTQMGIIHLTGVPVSVMTVHQKIGASALRRVLDPMPQDLTQPPISQRWTRRENRALPSLVGRAQEFRDQLDRTVVVRFDPKTPLEDVLAAYRNDLSVETAEPVRIYRASFIPTDPLYGSLWGLAKIGAPQAWDISTGTGVVVAVVDSGVDFSHPDLAASQWTNTDEIPGNHIDDDRNGYVDDVHGWDFISSDNDPSDVVEGHGTHVSGTIAASANNGQGIVGVAFNAHVMAVRALDINGEGTSESLSKSIIYATNNGADVINASWGGSGGTDSAIASAVSYALAHGVVFVAAAGNDGNGVPVEFPANLPGVIAVAATDRNDAIANFSNTGNALSLAAPGVDILSCFPGADYQSLDGTSMATPHVSGVVALLLSYWPQYTVAQVKSALTQNTDDLGAHGFDTTFGYGRLNAQKVMAAVEDKFPPSSPSNLTATPISSSGVRLRWGAATDDIGVRGYAVARDGVFLSTVTTLAFDDSGLTADTDYSYSVTAIDFKDKVSPPLDRAVHTPLANPNPGSATARPFPNPCPPGQDPTLRVWMEFMDELEISVYDVSGTLVHRTRLSGEPTGFVNGNPYHDYRWTDSKATGNYLLIAVGKRSGATYRARSRFSVVR